MAWSVDDIYNLMKMLTRSNQSTRISASELFYAFNSEQNAYQSDLLGKWQNRNNTKTGANTGLILNETIMTDLAPFIIEGSLPIVSGVATKPGDFVYGLADRIVVGGDSSKVKKINHGQISYVNESVIDPPSVSEKRYYMVEYEDRYKLLPTAATGSLRIDYVASPTDVVWAFTLDPDGRQVYDPINSVQPKWSSATTQHIVKRALASLGVSLKDGDLTNFGAKNIVTGDS